ncbi:MAG: MASE4 domain-containing protein [Acetobacteraceae bacterium]
MAVIAGYGLAVVVTLPFAAIQLPEIPALTPFFVAVVLIVDLATAFLLVVLFRTTGRLSLLLLGCTYLFAGAMAVLHLLTFPGVLQPGAALLGTYQTSAWAIMMWWVGHAFLTLLAICVECLNWMKPVRAERVDRAVGWGVVLVAIVAAIIAMMAIRFVDLLPPLLRGAGFTGTVGALRSVSIAMMLGTVILSLLVAGRRSHIFLWLGMAMTAMLCVNVLTLASGGRGTLGWSLGRISWLVSASVLFLFFMNRFANQLRVLARARGELEERVRARTADLTRTIRQRDLLLREVYHRVKNNMQVIDAMLFMERRRISDPAARDLINVLRNRVYSLGLVHQQLMASESLEYFDIAPFLRELIENLAGSAGAAERGIALAVETESAMVTLDTAIPVGLLATELVTNSFRHAEPRHLSVGFRRRPDGMAELKVADDGREPTTESCGATGGAQAGNSQGGHIVAGLARQLGGRVETVRNGGMRVSVVFPLEEGQAT